MDVVRTLFDAIELLIFVAVIAIGYFNGRRIERRHLAELKQREAAAADVLVFATRYPPPGDAALDPVLLSGGVVIAADAFKMFASGLRKFVGGRFNAFEMLVQRARREAMLRLKEEARAKGCRMVFNLRVETTMVVNGAHGGSSAVEALVYGTGFVAAQGTVAASQVHHVSGPPAGLESQDAFDLAKNPASLKVLIGFGCAVVYVFAEMLGMQRWAYVSEDGPWLLLPPLCLAASIGLAVWMTKRKVPPGESVVVALIMAIAFFGASYYAVLRLNGWTDFADRPPAVYVLTGARLVPADPALPVLNFPQDWSYWTHQAQGSEHRFTLSRGALGFWQYDVDEYYARLRAYYLKREWER